MKEIPESDVRKEFIPIATVAIIVIILALIILIYFPKPI